MRILDGVSVSGTTLLLVCAFGLALWPGGTPALTGLRGDPEISPPDELAALSREDPTPFFQSRDLIEVRVAETTTLRWFLDRNRLNKPYHRKQIEEQLGNSSPDAEIAAGTVFRIRLTPVAEDVPGTSSPRTR